MDTPVCVSNEAYSGKQTTGRGADSIVCLAETQRAEEEHHQLPPLEIISQDHRAAQEKMNMRWR